MANPRFLYLNDEINVARALRLAVVQAQYDQGGLTEKQARVLLSGRLSLEYPDTIVDDSEYLRIKNNGACTAA